MCRMVGALPAVALVPRPGVPVLGTALGALVAAFALLAVASGIAPVARSIG